MKTFFVDFNEMPERDVVLLSQSDTKTDIDGVPTPLQEGTMIEVVEIDFYKAGEVDQYIFGTGEVQINRRQDWSSHVKWCVKVDKDGIKTSKDHPKFDKA